MPLMPFLFSGDVSKNRALWGKKLFLLILVNIYSILVNNGKTSGWGTTSRSFKCYRTNILGVWETSRSLRCLKVHVRYYVRCS